MKTNQDITLSPDLQSHSAGTGPTRTQHPVYANLLPPCNQTCPAGENIQGWLSLAQAGRYEAAWRTIMEDNPFPAVMGRVCYHTCEVQCNRSQIDSAVNIHAVERFLGDEALQQGWTIDTAPPTGKRVLIVGAGPAGLSAAYHLVRKGHTVEIHEAGPIAGGMMHFGIPAYRLPRHELDQEVARICKMGVTVKYNHKVENLLLEKEQGKFDAVFLAIGSNLSKKVDLPTKDAFKMMDALAFLKQVEDGTVPKLGRRVAIYGGGNTAMDAARTAKRLGVEDTMIIYRRDRANMSAHDFEAQEALEEGVNIHWLRSIKSVEGMAMTVEVMELKDGKPYPTGRFETLEADSLIMALGQEADTAFLKNIPGITFTPDDNVCVDSSMMTGYAGIFAGGDMVPGERNVTTAIGHGKKTARNIDAYLNHQLYTPVAKPPVIGYEKLHRWYRTYAPQETEALRPAAERISGFDEVRYGLQENEVLFEARRCLSCGNCFECDGCFGACPQKAITKLGPGNGYSFNYDICTGCAVCSEQCSCHAIEMVPGR